MLRQRQRAAGWDTLRAVVPSGRPHSSVWSSESWTDTDSTHRKPAFSKLPVYWLSSQKTCSSWPWHCICSSSQYLADNKHRFWSSAAAAATKSLRLCPTLRNPIDSPTRLPSPWDSPGENTGVCCHFLLQCTKVKSESEVSWFGHALTVWLWASFFFF